jgi:hypothetical protein
MPLNIDLNTPCIDHESMECNIETSIDLNYPSMTPSTPSSSTFNLFSIDLNDCPTNEEDENELEHRVLPMEDINIDDEDINIDDLFANGVLPMEFLNTGYETY